MALCLQVSQLLTSLTSQPPSGRQLHLGITQNVNSYNVKSYKSKILTSVDIIPIIGVDSWIVSWISLCKVQQPRIDCSFAVANSVLSV